MSLLTGVAVVAGVSAWPIYTMVRARQIARDPYNHPEITSLERPPLLLRLGHFDSQVRRLEDRGFVEIGTKLETLGLLVRIPSRVLYHPEHRTYAGIFSRLGAAALTFITELEDGEIIFTGTSDRKLVRYGRLHEQGLTAMIRPKLKAHLALLEDVCSGPRGPAAVTEPFGSMEHRLALTRRYYIERFSAPVHHKPTTF